jgi:hypothetical protein
MRPNTSMIPKSCRLFGQDHATGHEHDPEKLQIFRRSDRHDNGKRRVGKGAQRRAHADVAHLSKTKVILLSFFNPRSQPGGTSMRSGWSGARSIGITRLPQSGYCGMPALRRPSLRRSCCCRYCGLVSTSGTGERLRNVDTLVSGRL